MTIVQLEYIVAVDTYRSFGMAADKCFVTQPTMSMQVQKLDESLGELSMAGFSVKQLDRVRYFRSPGPSREISMVTHRNFLKKKLISVLEQEIMMAVPKRMQNKNKKQVLDIH